MLRPLTPGHGKYAVSSQIQVPEAMASSQVRPGGYSPLALLGFSIAPWLRYRLSRTPSFGTWFLPRWCAEQGHALLDLRWRAADHNAAILGWVEGEPEGILEI